MKVHENTPLVVKNLISYRGVHTQQELQTVSVKLMQYLKNNGVEPTGKPITAVHSADSVTGATDSQIFVPIDREIPSADKFTFMPELNVSDCLLVQYKGSPQLVNNVLKEVTNKAEGLGRKIVKPAYSIVLAEPTPANMFDVEIDIYVPLEG